MKLLRMFVNQGDEVVEVGRCHPGQARILQKKGVAEIRDGKVWMSLPPKESGVTIHLPEGADPVALFEEVSEALEAREALNFPGWTPFDAPRAYLAPPVVCWDFPKDSDHPLLRQTRVETNKETEEANEDVVRFFVAPRLFTEEEKAELLRLRILAPFPNPEDLAKGGYSVFGCYKIVHDHLFRVWYWKGACTWDESILLPSPDGRYLLLSEGRHIDSIYTGDTSKISLLAPAGFPEQIRAAEARIVEFMCTRNHPEQLRRDEARLAEFRIWQQGL